MDKKVYEKTRYQNIYRHKKNKNYVIMMSKPVKTSISRVDGKRIMTTDDAIKVRDNIVLKKQKASETLNKETFDELWDKYMFWCKKIDKQSYNTYHKKEKLYNKYFKEKIKKPVIKIDTEFICDFIDNCETTDKQKNEIIKCVRTFFNWCMNDKHEYILKNPLSKVPDYRVLKSDMKYWSIKELNQFLETVHKDFKSNNKRIRHNAYLIYTLTTITFILGDRIGETRALFFDSVDDSKDLLSILHSINYDPDSNDFVSSTKTYESERKIVITEKIVEIINDFKMFLINDMGYNVKKHDLIFLNFETGRPYSDSTLRKGFNYYISKSEVSKIRMYDLRHTYAATMMSEGKEAYLFSERMGHKNIQTTINVYGHLSNEKRKEVAKSTDKYI